MSNRMIPISRDYNGHSIRDDLWRYQRDLYEESRVHFNGW